MNDEVDPSSNPYQAPREVRSSAPLRSRRSSQRGEREYGYKSLQVFGYIITFFFVVTIAISGLGIVFRNEQAELYEIVLNGGDVTYAEEAEVVGRVQVVAAAQLANLFVTAALFVTWFYRAYVNLVPLGVKRLEPRPAWAIGGWFIPVVNYFMPFIIVKQIWQNSSTMDVGKTGRAKKKPNLLPVIVWWLLWMSVTILATLLRQANVIRMDNDDPERQIRAALGAVNGATTVDIVRILAALGAVFFVLTVSMWQDKRYVLVCQLAEEQPVEAPDESNPYENYS